ncbi:MAG: hypothetical protein ACM3U2_18110 [Deltaproteobacteria bacterium]
MEKPKFTMAQQIAKAVEALRQEIRRITGVEVREASAEVETATGAVVQMFLLARKISTETWRGNDQGNQS